jgi:hypothetical protein
MLAVACIWWYLNTQLGWFLAMSGGAVLGGIVGVWRDLVKIQEGKKDTKGITTLVGTLESRDEKLLLLFISSTPLIIKLYPTLVERTLLPSATYRVGLDPVIWFLFSGLALSFASWVDNSRERQLWVIAAVFCFIRGLQPIILAKLTSPEFFRDAAIAIELLSQLSAVGLVVTGWRLFRAPPSMTPQSSERRTRPA